MRDNLDLVLQVVEHQQRVAEEKDRLWEALGVRIGRRQLLIVACNFVRQEPDRATVEAGETLHRHHAIPRQFCLDLRQRVTGRLRPVRW